MAYTRTTWVDGSTPVDASRLNNIEAALADAGSMAAWTTTLSNLTIGAGTVSARYNRVNGLIYFELRILFAADTAITGTPSFTLPVNAKYSRMLYGNILDSGSTHYMLVGELSTNLCRLYCANAGGTYLTVYTALSSTVPITFAANDVLFISGTYEAA